MNFLSLLVSQLKRLVRSQVQLSIAVAAVLILFGAGGLVFAATSNSSNQTKPAATQPTEKTAQETNPDQPQATTQPTDTAGTVAAVNTAQTKPVPAAPAPKKGPRTLVASPSTFTIKAGEPLNSFTVTTSDGAAVNMPFFTSQGPGLLFNFPAGPAKKSWTGGIASQRNSTPGTHQLQIMAQTNDTTEYTTTITVIILPTPIMTVEVQALGYDAEFDALTYLVKTVRHYGYDEPVNYLYASSPQYGLGYVCVFEEFEPDIYVMACGHESGPRPTSGVLFINAFTDSDTWSGSTNFTLPAL